VKRLDKLLTWWDNESKSNVVLAHVLPIVIPIVKLVGLFILARIAIRIATHGVHKLLHAPTVKMDDRRRGTLASLLDNLVRYTIYFIYIVMMLSTFGIHVETLLAGAGIAGVALGFGAQSLIRDILTGFFILFEDQYGVGDLVKINQFTGTVVSIGLRLTRLQAWTGEIEIIPNGQILQVTNYSKANSLAVIDMGVSYRTDLNKAMAVMQEAMQSVQAENDNIVGEVKILGVQALGERDVVLRVTAECRPTTQFSVQRQAYLRIKEAFDRAGIEIPYQQRVVFVQSPGDDGTVPQS
jgi:small-conductance mechanosensitive channel